MFTSALILLLAKCLFVGATEKQIFLVSASEQSVLTQILAQLKENKQQLQNFQEENKQQFQKLETQINEIKSGNSLHQLPKNCKQVLENGNKVSGIYTIRPESSPEPILVLCDMDSDGGGWTLLFSRFKGTQHFDRSWDDYKRGFGNLAGDFWLGLENFYHLTGFETNELLIKLVDVHYNETSARYSLFSIGSEAQGYFLKALGGYSGDATDRMWYYEGMKFSTKDRDQDLDSTGNCAKNKVGGWWYRNCAMCYLTSEYGSDTFYWEYEQILKEVKMMVRPKK